MQYDTIIVGASAAGMSAAIYAARRGLHFIVVTDDIGGEMIRSGEIGNYPGVKDTDGISLTQIFEEQMKEYTVDLRVGQKVVSVEKNGNEVRVTAEKDGGRIEYVGKSVIIATGIHPRELNVPGEKDLRGKGVTYCTVCDGPLFRGKITATVGAGNSALESVLMMSGIAKEVYLVNKYDSFPRGDKILVDKVSILENVHILSRARTLSVEGTGSVEGLKYYDEANGEEKILAVQGVMVHIGMVPNSQIVDVEKNLQAEIIIDKKCRTSVPGIFAAGDVTDMPYKQIAMAAGSGVCAALSMVDYVNRWEH